MGHWVVAAEGAGRWHIWDVRSQGSWQNWLVVLKSKPRNGGTCAKAHGTALRLTT